MEGVESEGKEDVERWGHGKELEGRKKGEG